MSAFFVVAGGPSLKAFDFGLLRNVPNVIAINGAMRDVPTADWWITEDARFITRFAAESWWKAFKGRKLFACPDEAYVPEVKTVAPEVEIVRSRPKSLGWSKRLEDGLGTSSCSLIPALNLADVLGGNPIYLLGVDLGDDPTNYHTLYPASWANGSQQMASYRSDVELWAAPNLRHRAVVNLNRDSRVGCFPKTRAPYNEAVQEIVEWNKAAERQEIGYYIAPGLHIE